MSETITLIPVPGCWVLHRQDTTLGFGIVGDVIGKDQVEVEWIGKDRRTERLCDLKSGIQQGFQVLDTPLSATRQSLGRAAVIATRVIANSEQACIQTEQDGRSYWLPFQRLQRIKSVEQRYALREPRHADHAERFRLRVLAHALESWNQLTGALDRLAVDPLPHQIQLVHRIITSGNANWLIADDVGLGKTIETGLLLAALKRSGQARRVLIVCPSGLTLQWRDEMTYKFGMDDFAIYGRQFHVEQARDWKRYDHCIVSLDLAKRENHLNWLRQSGGWDVVVFDEGHKLARQGETGMRTERYKLAETLRAISQAFVVLTATPHQGDTDRFIALLQLIRPDLRRDLRMIESRPELAAELVLRNRKADVTDADGNFIFHGQDTHRIETAPSSEMRAFRNHLDDYLRRGYRAAERDQGTRGMAIGFVMTTYRKLASSSIAAIELALQRRLARLTNPPQDPDASLEFDQEETEDRLFDGDDTEDDLAARDDHGGVRDAFFRDEAELLHRLLSQIPALRRHDTKMATFLDLLQGPMDLEDKKLLVFTEYRATQDYLVAALSDMYPDVGIVQINGSMNMDQKQASIRAFNDTARFLISTEAGGEGLNLHDNCHIMVNFDLPWNPARLVQRIGRLYRYGQKHRVVVLNLHARDTFDSGLMSKMLTRLEAIAQDMSAVTGEYDARLYADILGDLLDQVDMKQILKDAAEGRIERSDERIEEALARARRARTLQDEVFSHIAGYDPTALDGVIGFTMDHVANFVEYMLPYAGIELAGRLHEGRVFELRLPEALRGRFPEFAQRTAIRVSADRRLCQSLPDTVPLDFENSLFAHLIKLAQSQDFDGFFGEVQQISSAPSAMAAFRLRWQNDQGEPTTEEMRVYHLDAAGRIKEDAKVTARILNTPLASVGSMSNSIDPAARQRTFQTFSRQAEAELAKQSDRFRHPNACIAVAAADFDPADS